jgi:60 kDa SS-A/Ro ribonucleoprotein
MGFDTYAHIVPISPRERVDDVANTLRHIGGGGTDCGIPFIGAFQKGWEVDLFVSFTDSETWAGSRHVYPLLCEYRAKTGIKSRAINVAMAANSFTNFDIGDPLCLEIAGFDTSVPAVISHFARG